MNPSFEDYWQCPTQVANVEDCKYVFNPMCDLNNVNTNCQSTSDYFNACASISSNANVPYPYTGYQQAFDGNAYIGIGNDYNWYREYVQIKLEKPMIAGNTYPFSFYVNLANTSYSTTNQLGVNFVNDSIIYNQFLWQIMQADWVSNIYITDTANWQLLSGEYMAQGGEQWMIIGNFYPDTISPTIVVNPNSIYSINSYYINIDNVKVNQSSDTVNYSLLNIPNIFTPNSDGANDVWKISANVIKVNIYNRWGNQVFTANNTFKGWDGTTKKGKSCNDGIYYYIVTTLNKWDNTLHTHKGTITLLR